MDLKEALTGIAAIAQHSFKKLVFSKKAVITILVTVFVAAVMGYVGAQDVDPLADGTDLLDTLILFFFMPVMAMIFGSSLMRDEIDDKSITHVATAPLDRVFSYVGYYVPLACAVAVSMVIVNTGGFLAFFVQNDIGADALEVYLEFTALVTIGSFVYSALFLAVSVVFKKPVFFGLFYAFIWEGLIGSLPGNIQKVSVKHYLRSVGSDWVDYGSISSFEEASDPMASGLVLLVLLALFVLVGAYIFREMELS
jgi:ABC-2 type transport system permease protein